MAFKLSNTMFQPYRPPQNRFADISFGADSALARNEPVPERTSPGDRFSELYSKLANAESGPANKKYRDFLDTAEPSRADFAPNKMARLGAILSGVSESVSKGGFAGARTTQALLDRPYEEALDSRNRQRDILKSGAELENNDFKGRIGMLKDITDAQDKAADNKRADTLAQSTIEANLKRMEKMDYDMKNGGFTATVDIHGNRIYTNANGEVRNTGIKVAQSPEEKMADNKNLANYNSGLTLGRQLNFFNTTNPITNQQANGRVQMGIDAASQRQQSGQNFTTNRDRMDPNRQYSQEYLAARQVIASNPGIEEDFDPKTMQPLTDRARNMLRERLNMLYGSGGIPGSPGNDPRIVGVEE